MASIETIDHDLDFGPMHERMQSYVDGEFLPCVMTIVMRGTDVLDVATFGSMNLETKEPLREDAIFRMYSNTKIVTSIAAMMLHERGLFSLDDPVEQHLPEFADMTVLRPDATSIDDVEPARSPILVRHILSHTAGLSYGFIEPMSVIDQAYAPHNLLGNDTTLAETCAVLGSLPLAFHPGDSWRYSFATDVVARLVEVLAGRPFGDVLATELFEPLGMVDTGFFVPADKVDRFVSMYDPANFLDPSVPGLNPSVADLGDPYLSEPAFQAGGGGLVSTADDYLTFLRMIVNGGEWNGTRFVEQSTLDLMRTNQCAPGVGVTFPMWSMPGTTFGLGFALKESIGDDEPAGSLGEYHWGGMAGTHSWMAPEAGITGFCLTQLFPGFWHPFSHDFKTMTYDITADR